MRPLFIAAALCIAAQAVHAQAAPPGCAPAAAPAHTITRPADVQASTTPPAPEHGELIKTAAAGTRDGAHAAAVRPREEQPQHGGTAMLLAALALMSGIALRRWGGPRA